MNRIPKGELLPKGHRWKLDMKTSSVVPTAVCEDCDQAMILCHISERQIESHKTLRSCVCPGEYWLMCGYLGGYEFDALHPLPCDEKIIADRMDEALE